MKNSIFKINEELHITIEEHPCEMTLHYTDQSVDEEAYRSGKSKENPYHHIGISLEEARKLQTWLNTNLNEVTKPTDKDK